MQTLFTTRHYANVACAVIRVCFCLLCSSVTSHSSVKVAKRVITQTVPCDSPGNLVF